MIDKSLPKYKYNGARALVLLHEQHLKSCVNTWRKAKKLNIKLPETNNKDYESLETLLRHILRSARSYITWMCEKLNLPDPGIETTPEPDVIEVKMDEHVANILEKWRLPLADVAEERFDEVYKSRWGVDYCIDAMLEHAVIHPVRHEFQFRNLIEDQSH